jgi:class 3 adenylate cyclase
VRIQDLTSISPHEWEIPPSFRADMRVPVRIFATRRLLEQIVDDKSLEQAVNAATLPGLAGPVVVMPDMHQGYGFPIGGVAATEFPQGVISPGAIGYDINCGVRLLASSLEAAAAAPLLGPLVDLLNRYFSRQVAVVFRHGGTLDKFIGDCIMAFWGAPLEDPRHAEHAVAAALEMEQVLKAFKEELGDAGRDFDVGIGIHTGTAVVGFIGAEQKLDYTAIGDSVNLASRIEGLTKEAKSRILVSRDTVGACHNSFAFSSRGSYHVKGRAQEVELFEPRISSV